MDELGLALRQQGAISAIVVLVMPLIGTDWDDEPNLAALNESARSSG